MNTPIVLDGLGACDTLKAAMLQGTKRRDAMERAASLRKALGTINIAITTEEHYARIRYALSLNLLSMAHLADRCKGERIAVCGSGPSLKDSLPHLRQFKGKIIACNKSHDFLLENGIKPWAGVILDPNEWCNTYQTPTQGVGYFIGSTVHHSVWQRFREAGIKPWLFVPVLTDTEHRGLMEDFRNQFCFVAGATTVGLRALNIGMHLGASVLEMHGFDSCYAPGTQDLHAHSKPHVDRDDRPITLSSRDGKYSFRCVTNGPMSRQILGFESFMTSLGQHMANGRAGATRLVVAGDGAIPWMAWRYGSPLDWVQHLDSDSMWGKYGFSPHWDYAANEPYKKESAA